HEEIAGLPSEYRSVIVLCYLEGRTHEQAAALLNRPVGTVRSRLARGRDRLRRALVRRGLTLSAPLVCDTLAREATSATLPAALAQATSRVASLLAADRTMASGTVSCSVSALTTRVLGEMLWIRWKSAILLFVAISLGAMHVSWGHPAT